MRNWKDTPEYTSPLHCVSCKKQVGKHNPEKQDAVRRQQRLGLVVINWGGVKKAGLCVCV